MTSGKFILSIRLEGENKFGVLSQGDDQKYDDASREKRRRYDAVLEFVKDRRDGWASNYPAYRNASFRIEQFDNDTGEVKVVAGVPYDRLPTSTEQVRQELVVLATDASARFKKSPTMLSDYLFVEAERAIPNQTAWRTVSLEDRIRIVREVAAGFFTPAIA